MIWWRCLKRILAARLHGRPRGRAWLVRVPPVAPSNYLPKEPWLAETFESP